MAIHFGEQYPLVVEFSETDRIYSSQYGGVLLLPLGGNLRSVHMGHWWMDHQHEYRSSVSNCVAVHGIGRNESCLAIIWKYRSNTNLVMGHY